MNRWEEMVGKRYGMLTVLSAFARKNRPDGLMVRCDCGVEKATCARSVSRGRTVSCGCAQRRSATRHGLSNHPEYSRWNGMIERCYRPSVKSYEFYGARGVDVCQEWRDSPEYFIEWAERNGAAPGKHLDRIDGKRGYSPENCRFVTPTENQNNRSTNVVINAFGRNMTIAEAAKTYRLPYSVVVQRIRKLKWAPERALSEPARKLRNGPAA